MENDTIDRLAEKYTDIDSLKAYSNAQFKTILKLTKRIEQLEKENQSFKEKSVGGENTLSGFNVPCPNGVTDEEAICIMELNKLRLNSMTRELTLEECRKVESYVKTLATIRNHPRKEESLTKSMNAEQLMAEFDKMMKDQDLVLNEK